MRKRILPILLALLMVIQLCPMTASAADKVYDLDNPKDYQALVAALREAAVKRDFDVSLPFVAESQNSFANLYYDVFPDADIHFTSNLLTEMVTPTTAYLTTDAGTYEGTIGFYMWLTTEQIDELDTKASQIIASFGFTSKTSDYEKVEAIYRYLCDNVVYDYDFNYEYSGYSYGALVAGEAVCAGYSAAFLRLATAVGLDARIISGETPSGPHAWNIVKLGERYYLLDSTWDAGYAPDNYHYFLKGSSDFPQHTASWEYMQNEFLTAYPIAASAYHPAPEHEHDWSSVFASEPGCETYAYSGETHCNICGFILLAPSYLSPTGHDYQFVDSTEPTCTEFGFQNYVCTKDSSHTYTLSIPPLGHFDPDKNGSCNRCGETTECTHSSISRSEQILPSCEWSGRSSVECCYWCLWTFEEAEEIAPLGHNYVLKASTEADCIHNGENIYVCSHNRFHIVSEVTPATGHTDTDLDAVCDTCGDAFYCTHWDTKLIPETPATCTQDGLTYGLTCAKCGQWLTTQDVIPATGHRYENGVCTDCGASDSVTNPFVDVAEDDYFYAPVLWAVDKGVTTGTSENTFSPSDPCTRGQVVTFLWRAMGKPDAENRNNPFVDVNESDFYYEAVLWAVENGITSGTGATTFSPTDPCTRGQVATFLWRTMSKPASSAANGFTDVAEGMYYYSAVLWAVENKITNGMGEGIFAPDATCNRAQIVTFLYRTLANK